MTLDNLMNMATADRYTEDGRQQIEDARRTYKPGEISEATGLQKQNDGTWAPPKTEAAPGSNSEATESKSRYEGLTSLAQLSPEDLKAFRERHMANYGEGNDYRLSRNGRTAALRARSKEEARDVLRLTGWGRVALNNIEEIKRKPAGSSNWKADDFQEGVLNSPDGEYSVFQENGKWTLQSSKGSKEGYASKEEAMKAAESGIDLSKKAGGKSAAAPAKIDVGSDVKVKVNGGRPGKVTKIRGDVVTVEMPAQGDKPARTDTYYKSDLEADSGSSREEAYKKEGFSNLKKYNSQDEAESEMWTHIRTAEMSKDDVDAIKLYKAPDGKFKWTDDPAKQKDLEGYGYEEVQKSDYLRNQARDSAPGCNDELVYTPESINEPREKLERQLTGDTRIRVKK